MKTIKKPLPEAICVLLFLLVGCTAETDYPAFRGEYLGLDPPGMDGELFAPGVMSTGMDELNSAFFPGAKEAIFSVHTGDMKWALLTMKEIDGQWTKPEVASFSGKFGGVDPVVSFDGNRVFFCSNRPLEKGRDAKEDYDIWYVDRTESGWSDPVRLGEPINTDAHEFYPSLAENGTMYFQSSRPGGIGASDIYKAEWKNGRYIKAEILPEPINSPGFEGDAFIAPDESYIIVSTYREGKNIGRAADLYISFLQDDGVWSDLLNMGERVNSKGGENCQILSPCRKYLFYTSRRYKNGKVDPPLTYVDILNMWTAPQNGYGDVYWVDAKIIDELKNKL
jgi:hypothetical protein